MGCGHVPVSAPPPRPRGLSESSARRRWRRAGQGGFVTQTAIVTSSRAGEWLMVTVNGEIDVHTGPALRDHLLSAFGHGEDTVIVDLAQVSFLDSSGLGVLVSAHKRARTTGEDLRIAACSQPVATFFQI